MILPQQVKDRLEPNTFDTEIPLYTLYTIKVIQRTTKKILYLHQHNLHSNVSTSTTSTRF